MAKFPIIKAQGSKAIQRQVSADTGAAEVSRAAARFGEAIFDLGVKFDIMDADTQLVEAKRLAQEELNRLADDLSKTKNTKTYEAEFEKSPN